MPILVTQNLKRECMFNMVEFKIDEIDEHGTSFKVNNVWFKHNDFRQSFIPAFCCTVYKYQGADIKENYNILDVNGMDEKKSCTLVLAELPNLFEYIFLNNQKLNRKYVPRLQPILELMNSHFNSDFLYGKIYEVTFENSDKIYAGLTCEKLDIRLKCRVANKTSQVYKNRKYIPKMKLIVKAPTKDRKTLE